MKYIINNEDDTMSLAKKLASENIKCLLLDGDLGVGKTTFTKYYAKYLGEDESVSSPTYSIVKEYKHFYHFDLYRINDEDELYDIDFDNYLFSDKQIVIEWPLIAKSFLNDKYTKINMYYEGDHRIFEVIYDFSF